MKLEKIVKILSANVVEEMDAMSAESLEKQVCASEQAISDAEDELDANPKYEAAKQAVSDISAGMKDVRKYQRAKIAYAIHRLREAGRSV